MILNFVCTCGHLKTTHTGWQDGHTEYDYPTGCLISNSEEEYACCCEFTPDNLKTLELMQMWYENQADFRGFTRARKPGIIKT